MSDGEKTPRQVYEELLATNPMEASVYLRSVGVAAVYPTSAPSLPTVDDNRRALIAAKHRTPVRRFADSEAVRLSGIQDESERARAKATSDAKVAEMAAHAEQELADELFAKKLADPTPEQLDAIDREHGLGKYAKGAP